MFISHVFVHLISGLSALDQEKGRRWSSFRCSHSVLTPPSGPRRTWTSSTSTRPSFSGTSGYRQQKFLSTSRQLFFMVKVCFLRCCGSVTFWYGSGARIGTTKLRIRILLLAFKIQTKNKVFCLLLFEGTFPSFFKDN